LTLRYRLSAAAQDDLVDIFAWTNAQFGADARMRYEALVVTALRDVATQPERAGSLARPELGNGVRSWHLRLSRQRARTAGGVVHRPRHFLVYRMEPELLVVGRVLHDAMELARHLNPAASWE
jgi:toxin ParE1/3/4